MEVPAGWRELGQETGALLGELQRKLDAWEKGYLKKGGRICCAKGCSTCCHISVRIPLVEAITLLPLVTPEAMARVRARAEAEFALALVANTEDEFVLRHREEVGSCPLLDAAGACTVHKLRPGVCRSVLSTMPGRYCDEDHLLTLRTERPAEFGAYLEQLDPRVNDVTASGGGVLSANHFVRPTRELTREEAPRVRALMQQRFGFVVAGQLPLMVLAAADAAIATAALARDRAGTLAALQALPGYHERLAWIE